MGIIPVYMVTLFLTVFSITAISSSMLMSKGNHLSVENYNDTLISPNGVFAAGFYPAGENAYSFSIWFSIPSCTDNCTVVWTANRGFPVNGRKSKLSLTNTGNLILFDADNVLVWSTNTKSLSSSTQLNLNDNGNLLLRDSESDTSTILWQSFDSPTDTLLPHQPITKKMELISGRSQSNHSAGFFKLFFDNDNVLRLVFEGIDVSGIYWPGPELMAWQAGRYTYNNTRTAQLDSIGGFSSTDNFTFFSAEYGLKNLQRRLTMDFDGNLRLYSRNANVSTAWVVSWQAISQPCGIHAACGPNSVCSYVPNIGRKCSCVPAYKVVNPSDWSFGCEPEFNISCAVDDSDFLQLTNVEFFGYDFGFYPNYTLEMCESVCLQRCDCKGFQFKSVRQNFLNELPYCYPKTSLLNGQHSPNFPGDLYLKVAKSGTVISNNDSSLKLDCSAVQTIEQMDRSYARKLASDALNALLWAAIIVGVIEFFVILLVYLCTTRENSHAKSKGYALTSTGLKRFTYAQLKEATRGFTQEIGRGGGGVVYRGVLSDHRIAAIKRLHDANQGQAEFLAEIGTIGKLNHINLIEMWGYCAEKKQRLLVYEYMEHGSLADNLNSNSLDGKRRFDIAVGTAKCMAYLHEECLEWVLHCDIKPQNILLDSKFRPKVSDFGLSRLQNRSGLNNPSFSRIRGTRGYMAPEWVLNLPITSKVDVYSYGIVVLELVTGKSPVATESGTGSDENLHKGMVKWVREKMDTAVSGSSIEEVMDPVLELEGKLDKSKMETMLAVALKCVVDDRDARPTMSQVIEMLLMCYENDNIEEPTTSADIISANEDGILPSSSS